jgi:hypothetical protein
MNMSAKRHKFVPEVHTHEVSVESSQKTGYLSTFFSPKVPNNHKDRG